MYTCRVLVKHGVSLVTGSRRDNSLTPSSEKLNSTTSPAHSAFSFTLFSVRSIANSLSPFGVRQAASSDVDSELQWRSAGDWQGLRHKFGTDSVGSSKNLKSESDSASIVRPRSAAREASVEVARESQGGAERAPKFDVSSNCVTPMFRVSPFLQQISDLENRKVRVLFLSEGNVCRSVYAEAIFNSLIEEHGMQEFVECASKASRDYNVGESPDSRAVAVAEEMGLRLPEGTVARVFNCQADIVLFDLLLVMDKFNASDVLKEVTVYEAIDKEARYTHKVRRLAEFCRTKKVLLRESYEDIRASCIGLMQTILEIKASLPDSETLKQGVGKSLGEMESLDWLVPPMFQKAETIFN